MRLRSMLMRFFLSYLSNSNVRRDMHKGEKESWGNKPRRTSSDTKKSVVRDA